MVGREGSREGAGTVAAKAGTPRADRSMDHRRHELSQERAAFGRGGSTILRRAWQAVAGIQSHTTVWAPGTGPRPPKKWSGQGRPPKLLRRDDKHKPASVKELALGAGSRGREPRGRSCPRDFPVCAFVSRIAITGSPPVGRRNGC